MCKIEMPKIKIMSVICEVCFCVNFSGQATFEEATRENVQSNDHYREGE